VDVSVKGKAGSWAVIVTYDNGRITRIGPFYAEKQGADHAAARLRQQPAQDRQE
jgi:uncharacterized protein YegP (UPF0339 family)